MFGCGKTELAVNFSRKLRESFSNVALADIDTISPYFRSRDVKEKLESEGIKVITPPGNLMFADLPMIVPQVGGYIQNESFKTVLDVGGNDDGATVLGSLGRFFGNTLKSVFFVINVNRPFSSRSREICDNIDRLEEKGRIKVDFLINNTNIGSETTIETIKKGEEILLEVQKNTGKKVIFTSIMGKDFDQGDFSFPIFRFEKFMKNVWEQKEEK